MLTDLLDLAGLLLVVAALAVAAAAVGLWLALAVAGLGLLGVSWLVEPSRSPRARRGGRR
ncbi:hypothetical protein [Cellulomonas oligotrophica]|uniref:Uncharacterized protein n=1 Tax=Cellulomonas oligotrophica TaxID=931536 RepID=A0A7Y9K0E5_9CELL|nr:hypothetical protein [Cellulomonas oligotrophica]NYD87784.1 hypothetical protein [Cellulomonas oligotrophica]GIG33012.1 hypothetical protein Col01nite_21710 [Cellulomonas oligotrophica]